MEVRAARRKFSGLLVLCILAAVGQSRAGENRHFTEKKSGGGELRYINDVPVLLLGGTPEEIGRQAADHTTEGMVALLEYPHKIFPGESWTRLLSAADSLWPRLPSDHRAEIEAVLRVAKVDRKIFMAGNVMTDAFGKLGCSSLIVEPARSRNEGPLFGRNLDFPNACDLNEYTLVTVCRPRGKHAFASVGFPGMFGCLSGINDAGLALAVHLVFITRDDSKVFDPEGVPCAFAFRRVLEECATVDEGEKLLRSIRRTTLVNLALCDRQKAIILEMTPKNIQRRDSVRGLCVCTNHFRTEPLTVFPFCGRYDILTRGNPPLLDVAELTKKLHAASFQAMTLQTMIFEPRPLILHLAFGDLPASSGPMHVVNLGPLLESTK